MYEPKLQVEFQLGHLCTNRCVFCVSGQMSEQGRAPQLPEGPIREEISRAHAAGARKVTFLGGEPTIQRSFFSLLDFVVALDFDEIVLFTNGVMTTRKSFRDRVMAVLRRLGPDMRQRVIWRFSLQGGDAAAHDATTTREGSFARIIESMEILHAQGARLSGNMCVVSTNYASVAGLAEIAARFGLENLHLDMVRSRDAGDRSEDYLRGLMTRYSDMVPSFRALVQSCDRLLGEGFDLNIGNLPYCVAPDISHRMHHDGEMTVTISASGEGTTKQGIDKYKDKRQDKHKLEACGRCVFDGRCGGFFDLYARFHGHDELRPVSSEDLWRIDTRGRHFVLLALPDLRAVAATRAGLHLGLVDEPAAEVEATLAVGEGQSWQLCLRRAGRGPGRAGWATVRAGRVEAALMGPMPTAPGALATLATTLEVIAARLGGTDALEADVGAVPGQWAQARERFARDEANARRARRAGLSLAQGLQGVTLAGLRQLETRRDDTTGWVDVVFGRSDVALTLSIGLNPNSEGRPTLRHQSDGLTEAEVAAFNAALGRHLRARRRAGAPRPAVSGD